MKFLELRIPPPLIALALGVAMWWVAKGQPKLPIEPWLRVTLAAVVAVSAFVIAISGVLALRRAGTILDPIHVDRTSAMVTTGGYGVSRNPMYTGLVGMLTSWAMYLAVSWAFVGPVLLALYTYRFQILPEERAMEAKFGAEFLAYKQRVRRWL
jgi:protein-S-isoprenylcysteine O-methyltransferase Ste14